mmetsp:Transcript_26488/g.26881  ORF Transcript_26488/g.26881 Transcript_26488/m.26881 type:complete len:112 (-) Transcript_26488:67-402(-)
MFSVDGIACICDACFYNSNHNGTEFSRHSGGKGCCDCGDAEFWKTKGCCNKYRPLISEIKAKPVSYVGRHYNQSTLITWHFLPQHSKIRYHTPGKWVPEDQRARRFHPCRR